MTIEANPSPDRPPGPIRPGPAAIQAARSIARYCETRFPTDSPPNDLLDVPWFAERVQRAIDEATARSLNDSRNLTTIVRFLRDHPAALTILAVTAKQYELEATPLSRTGTPPSEIRDGEAAAAMFPPREEW